MSVVVFLLYGLFPTVIWVCNFEGMLLGTLKGTPRSQSTPGIKGVYPKVMSKIRQQGAAGVFFVMLRMRKAKDASHKLHENSQKPQKPNSQPGEKRKNHSTYMAFHRQISKSLTKQYMKKHPNRISAPISEYFDHSYLSPPLCSAQRLRRSAAPRRAQSAWHPPWTAQASKSGRPRRRKKEQAKRDWNAEDPFTTVFFPLGFPLKPQQKTDPHTHFANWKSWEQS